MSRFARHLIVWIIAALLPLQGYAAAAMISCGPMHAQAVQSDDDAGHDGHAVAHQGHHGTAADRQGDSGRTAPHLPDLLKLKCSACAACCTGTLALSYVVPFSGVMPNHPMAISFSAPFHDGIVPDALERPPRTSLA